MIDCSQCQMRETEICQTCVVSFFVAHDPEDATVFDVHEERALRVLQQAGLFGRVVEVRNSLTAEE